MTVILIESVLFLAFLAIVGTLVFRAMGITPVGRRLQQAANRRRIDRTVELTCPIHGLQAEETLVRLSTGETLCSHCYQEAVHGHVN